MQDHEAAKGELSEDEDGKQEVGDSNDEFDITKAADANAEYVDLEHFRIGELKGFEYLTNVAELCLRNNLISDVSGLSCLSGTLKNLDLYDNKLKKYEEINKLTKLEILDLSFNLLRKMESLDCLPQLKKLYLVSNKITKIENVNLLSELVLLELGDNRIKHIENLEHLTKLEELYLGKNKLVKIVNLDQVVNLRILALQSNRITVIEGLDNLVNLEQLYISHNGIEVLQGLENNTKLQTLDIAGNRIKKIENISHLKELQEFWANDNQIHDWKDLDVLANCTKLVTVYLERNPLQTQQMADYRRKVMLALPSVQQIDASMIRG